MTPRDDGELTAQAARIEALLAEIQSFPDPAVQGKVVEILQGLLALYGAGLARVLEIVGGPERAPERLLEALAEDDLVAHLLMLHDLHPHSLEARVARGLEEVRPYLQSHGGNVELLGVEGGVARVRLEGSCRTCPSSADTLRAAVEEAVRRTAPDLAGIVAEEPEAARPGFVPAEALLSSVRPSLVGQQETVSPSASGQAAVHG